MSQDTVHPGLVAQTEYLQLVSAIDHHSGDAFGKRIYKRDSQVVVAVHCGDGKQDSWDKQSNYLLLGCNSTCMIVGQGCFMHLHLHYIP